MRSSSQLFPVSLISAEFLGDLTEDVYLLNPGRSADTSVRLALARVNVRDQPLPDRPPVVLLHGAFCNRHIWVTLDGKGLAGHLARLGYDVWIPEMRGHGLSPVNRQYSENRLEDYWRDDLPAINDFIIEQTHHVPVWIGHGMGGITLTMSLAMGALPQKHVRALSLLGPRISRPGKAHKLPGGSKLSAWWVGRKEIMPMERGVGTDAEPSSILRERMLWNVRGGIWSLNTRDSLWARLEQLHRPLLVMIDQNSSAKASQEAEAIVTRWSGEDKSLIPIELKQPNQSAAVEPTRLVSGTLAEAQVWPKLAQWIQRQQPLIEQQDSALKRSQLERV